MACEPGHLFVDLWALNGYAGAATTGKERWERRHRIKVPWKAYWLVLTAGDDEGHVVVGTKLGVLAYNVRSGAVRLLTGVDASGGGQAVDPSRHVLRESLVRHDFFERRPHPGLPFFSFCT
jgi:outer membrane protein assembly factor BamB